MDIIIDNLLSNEKNKDEKIISSTKLKYIINRSIA